MKTTLASNITNKLKLLAHQYFIRNAPGCQKNPQFVDISEQKVYYPTPRFPHSDKNTVSYICTISLANKQSFIRIAQQSYKFSLNHAGCTQTVSILILIQASLISPISVS